MAVVSSGRGKVGKAIIPLWSCGHMKDVTPRQSEFARIDVKNPRSGTFTLKDNNPNQVLFIIMVMILIVLGLSFVALAFGSGTWGFGMMGFSPFFMLLPVLFVILVVILIARAMDGGPRIYQVPQTHNLPSVDPGHVARERYARGEISRDEFLQIIEDLRAVGRQGR